MLKPTQEQLEILSKFKLHKQLKVNAISGSGKTSTLVLLADDNPVKSLYVAFNKAIAVEAESRFPKHVTCKTTHSLAYAQFGTMLYSKLNAKHSFSTNICSSLTDLVKFFSIQDIADLEDETKVIKARTVASLVRDTVSNFQNSADDEISSKHVNHGELYLMQKVHKFNKELFIRNVVSLADKLWKERIDINSAVKAEHDTYLKLWCLSKPKLNYEIIYCDEAQDTNPAILDVILRQTHAKICFVGDTYQSIYAFRGAVNAMEQINAETCLLTQSWRYGKEIAEVASYCISDAIPVIGNPKTNSKVVRSIPASADATHIFRTNSQLILSAYDMINKGVKVSIEIDTKNFISQLESVVALLRGDMQKVKHSEIVKYSIWDDFVVFTEENIEAKRMKNLAERSDIDYFIYQLSKVSTPKNAQIIMTTAHKSKGREWDNVVVHNDFKFSKEDDPLEGMPQQERNLLYVACTRAKLKLVVPDEVGYGMGIEL